MRKTLSGFIALSILLIGCPNWAPPGSVGSLILTFSTTEMGAKTLVPPFDMEVASYDISGIGPGSSVFSQTDVTGASATQNSLAVGAWTITIEAFNAADILIGSGSTAVEIKAGNTVPATVAVTPLPGKGTLTVNISWTPSGLIPDPSVVATLTPVGGSAQSLDFTPGTDSMSYTSGNTLDLGYYSLAIQLSDGAVVVWGSFEAVRILKGLTTTASFDLEAQDLLSGP